MFYNIQKTVGLAVLNLLPSYEKGLTPFLTNRRPLELLSDPDRIPYPPVEKVSRVGKNSYVSFIFALKLLTYSSLFSSIVQTYFELLYHEQIREWIIFGLACCPEACGVVHPSQKSLPKEKQVRGLDVLKKVLEDTYIITIFGDECISAHDPFEEIFPKFKSSTINLRRERKLLKVMEEKAAAESHDIHQMKRQYLRLQLKALLYMLRDNPGLLGPKFQLVIACSLLMKGEILWYFRHMNQIPRHANKKFKDCGSDGYIGECIHLLDEVSRLCHKHKDIISSYHREIMINLYHKKVHAMVEQHNTRFEAQIVHMFDSIVNDIGSASNFEAMRLNWRRLNAYLSGFHFKSSLTDPGLRELFNVLNKVYVFSRHIDDIDRELVECTSLRELYFFHKPVIQVFRQGLEGTKNEPFYSMSFVRILHYYADNINKFINPEMRKKVGQDSVDLAERILQAMCKFIEAGLSNYRSTTGIGGLADQIGGERVVQRVQAKMTKQPEPPIPGLESSTQNKASIEKFILMDKNITQLLYAIGMYEEIQVFDTVFTPVEFLRERLQNYANDYVKKLCSMKIEPNSRDAKAPEFVPPSETLAHIQIFARSLKFVEQCVNINTEDLVMSALLDNFVHLDYTEDSYEVSTSGEDVNNITKYAKWYADVVANASKLRLYYNQSRMCFLSTKDSSLHSYKVEDFFDIQELMALSELVGPYGIRAFDHHIMNHVFTTVEKIRETLSSQHSVLKEVEENIFEDALLDILSKKVKGMDQLFSNLITLGSLLVFRDNLRYAMENRMKKHVPILYNVVKATNSMYVENTFRDDRFVEMDGLASDCGLPLGNCDNVFKKKILSLAENSVSWEVLPVACAVMLTSSVWQGHNYDVATEGWDNNAHLITPALVQLINAVSSIRSPDPLGIENEFAKFATFSGQILLQMRLSGKFERQISSASIFADQTIKACPFMKARYFEDQYPYALQRAVYIQQYEHAQKKQSTQQTPEEQ